MFFAADIVFIREIQFRFCMGDNNLSSEIACFTSSADAVSKHLFDRYLYKSVISLYPLFIQNLFWRRHRIVFYDIPNFFNFYILIKDKVINRFFVWHIRNQISKKYCSNKL